MSIVNKIKGLYSQSGISLFLLRLPFRFLKYALDKSNTVYYRVFCKSFGHSSIIEFGSHIEMVTNVSIGKNVYIGKGTKIVSENINGFLTIGDNVHLGQKCHIDHTGNVIIGEWTLFSEGVKLFSHSHGSDPRSIPTSIDKIIGKGCWFGVDSILMESASSIADGTILGAAAVLTKNSDIPNKVYGGIPARIIK